ncbi:MAG: prmC, partial [Solirubrobacterales bacterium]|nr:prmC [Solirubrobacterales bacterium]
MRSAAGSKHRPRAPEALRAAAARLAGAGVDTPRLDAEVLLAHVLGVDRARLVLDAERSPSDVELAAFEALLRRREAREPVAYLVGLKGFRRLELVV